MCENITLASRVSFFFVTPNFARIWRINHKTILMLSFNMVSILGYNIPMRTKAESFPFPPLLPQNTPKWA